jgi:iodotyrosine deiodinase
VSTRNGYRFVPLAFESLEPTEQVRRAREFESRMLTRRTVRKFSPQTVDRQLIETALRVASRAPSGANQQPWRFVVISAPEIKRKIRLAAENEEIQNYAGRFPPEWLDALAPLETDWQKEFLEVAPWLIVVFRVDYDVVCDAQGIEKRVKHYYTQESVGIACGFLIAALHMMGLATVTHTPSPMGFLSRLLGRPVNERPFLLLPVGLPAEDAEVPDITKRPLNESVVLFD